MNSSMHVRHPLIVVNAIIAKLVGNDPCEIEVYEFHHCCGNFQELVARIYRVQLVLGQHHNDCDLGYP